MRRLKRIWNGLPLVCKILLAPFLGISITIVNFIGLVVLVIIMVPIWLIAEVIGGTIKCMDRWAKNGK